MEKTVASSKNDPQLPSACPPTSVSRQSLRGAGEAIVPFDDVEANSVTASSAARSSAQRMLMVLAPGAHEVVSERLHCAGDASMAAARRTIATFQAAMSARFCGSVACVAPASVCASIREAANAMTPRAITAMRPYMSTSRAERVSRGHLHLRHGGPGER
jgi:hypothetical protein